MKNKFLIILLLFHSFSGYAESRFDKCNDEPDIVEKNELRWSTPLNYLALSTVPVNLGGSIAMLAGTPNNTKSFIPLVATYSAIALNGFPILFFTNGDRRACVNVDQVPMNNADRESYRASNIKASYWIGGIQTVLAAGMYVGAKTDPAKIFTITGMAAPLITSLIVIKKFKQGPNREDNLTSNFNLSPSLSMDGNRSLNTGVAATYQF